MELKDYLNVVSARRGMIIAATLVVALTALAVSLIQPPQYEGTAKVLVSERDSGAALFGTVLPELSSQPERSLQTQVELIRLRPLAEQAIRNLNLEMTPQDLEAQLEITAVGQTNVVSVTARGSTPEEAAAIANALAEAYVEWSQDTKREALKRAADEVEQRLEAARTEILAIGDRLRASGNADELRAELQLATGAYTTLAEKLEQLRINEQLEEGSGRVVSPAVPNPVPVAPRPLRNALLGLMAGLVFGVSMAFLYEYLDNTIKSTEEAERLYGAPVLGIVPLDKMDKGTKRRLTIVDAPGSAAAESYRVLRNSLDFINFEHDLKTVLVTSAAPAEGKSTVASNLAASLSHAGKKVVLVSCDFRRPTTEQFFNVNSLIGLSDVLLGTHSLKAALQRPGDEQLLVLTSGKMPPNPSELLASAKMQEVIESIEEWADWIIIDSPPVLAVADPVSVARWVDGVLIVSKAGESTKEAAQKAVELLGKVGASIIGVAVWGLDESKQRTGYGYGYYTGGYYYYRSYYGAPQGSRKKKSASVSDDGTTVWTTQKSFRKRLADVLGKVLAAILAFLLVITIAALGAYLADAYFHWGLAETIRSMFPLLQ